MAFHDTTGELLQTRRAHAEIRAPASTGGIGAAVIASDFEHDTRVWECIVTDGREYHYIRVVGTDLGAYPNLSPEHIEQGIERFAATLPGRDRMRHLLNANPLHIDAAGNVRD
jgi:hypothetical protein